ncbi:branched-chain amino acid ABC transporter permease [Halobellus clavatus]|uniref:Branched-chain amino acid transport system permease protein n=1 Tax=Halobellus clavatus TaxID=660517 RepID=A0A1H3GZE7_9EURY|nr:branched-chain amino acid ABC transporter permease [Halobellus clavatus]SDY08497.1 branched-chain amino acid transport system permease protein [Halobellus clavatus]
MSLLERAPGGSLADDRRVQALGVVAVLALAVVPFVTTDSLTGLILTGLVYVMLGVSWNLIAGYAGQISLGHAAFFGMGAFASAWVTTPSGAGLPEALQIPVVAAVLVGGVVSALIALVIGPVIFRLTGHYFAIGTLALAAVIELVMNDRRDLTGGATGYYVNADIGLGETISHGDMMFFLTLLATVITVWVTYYIVRGPAGLGMKAIHDDEEAASSLGVNPLKYKMYAFVASSFFAGIAGALYAHFSLYINAQSTLAVTWTVDSLVVVILGGMGTFAGPFFGAGLFLLLDNGLSAIVGGWAEAVEGILIILFIIFLPSGLYGLVDDYLVSETADTGGEMDADVADD